MASYLVIHTPRTELSDESRPATRLIELARIHGTNGAQPRWLRTWSPDLHDDRIFTFWEASSAQDILNTIAVFGFLDHMDAQPINVREWGPQDVLDAVAHEGE
jgi:hypothetical protein